VEPVIDLRLRQVADFSTGNEPAERALAQFQDYVIEALQALAAKGAGYLTTTLAGELTKLVKHDLRAFPVVQVLEDGGATIAWTITHDSINQFTVTFASPFTGTIVTVV